MTGRRHAIWIDAHVCSAALRHPAAAPTATSSAAVVLAVVSVVSGLGLSAASARTADHRSGHAPTGSVSVMRRHAYGMVVKGVATDADTTGPRDRARARWTASASPR